MDNFSRSLRTSTEEEIRFRLPRKERMLPIEPRCDQAQRESCGIATGSSKRKRDVFPEERNEWPKYVRECEQIEMLANRNNARKLYQKVRRFTYGFQTEAFSCKNKNGNLMADIQSIFKLWREHFSNFVNSDNCACHREYREPDIPIVYDGTIAPLPDHDEVKIAITRLKNNKAAGADGLPAELFKHADEELVRCIISFCANYGRLKACLLIEI